MKTLTRYPNVAKVLLTLHVLQRKSDKQLPKADTKTSKNYCAAASARSWSCIRIVCLGGRIGGLVNLSLYFKYDSDA